MVRRYLKKVEAIVSLTDKEKKELAKVLKEVYNAGALKGAIDGA